MSDDAVEAPCSVEYLFSVRKRICLGDVR